MSYKLWLVSAPDQIWLMDIPGRDPKNAPKVHVLTQGYDREDAKKNAFKYLYGDTDWYIVTPLTAAGEVVFLNLRLVNR